MVLLNPPGIEEFPLTDSYMNFKYEAALWEASLEELLEKHT